MTTEQGFPRVSTGITKLDTILHGGIPEGNLTLVSGPPGSGKSTLGAQFLASGADNDETGVFISIGEDRDRIIRNLKTFSWNVADHIDDGRLAVVSPELYNFNQLVADIEKSVEDRGAQRIFLDSITVLKSYFEDNFTVRQRMMELRQVIDEMQVTTLATAERRHVEQGADIGVEEYVVDGVISMYYEPVDNGFQRFLAVKKMRGTEHSMDRYPVSITKSGVTINDA